MGKISTPWKPVDQSATTAPQTRVINPAKAGEAGSVKAAPQPLVSVAEMQSRAQKTPRPQIPVDLSTVVQLTPADRAGIPAAVTPDVAVETVSNYQERDV